MATVLVTGAAGFVGRLLTSELLAAGHRVKAAQRRLDPGQPEFPGLQRIAVGDISGQTHWGRALEGVDAVAHLAARAHILSDAHVDPITEYRRINVDASENLGRAAAAAGVKRLLFLSSIGVNGKRTEGQPFTESDPASPHDTYAVSKWKAECALASVAARTGLQLVIVRSPLVYGPHVKANFLRLMWLASKALPLPLGAVANRRSMIFVGNLVDALSRCIEHPAAAGQTFLVSDGQDVSTPEIIRHIARALGVSPRLFPFPVAGLKALAVLLSRSEEAGKLLDSLALDSSHIRRCLGWRPPYSLQQGIEVTARWYRDTHKAGR